MEKNVAFIPVRGGSKSIPLKNIKPICGKPLVYWTIAAACECKAIDKVYVATDNIQIADVVNELKKTGKADFVKKLEVIGRSEESATDNASTESAMLEFANVYNFETIVLIQATSPLLTAEDLEKGFSLYQKEDTDSVLSVVKQKRFHWSVTKDGLAEAVNYDIFHRPRRQEFEGYFVENGAFYITSKERLLHTKNRISGKIRVCEMHEDSFFEIDELSDWVVIEQMLAKKLEQKSVLSKKEKSNIKISYPIKMFLTDCDGCLTDGGMYYSEFGDELKKFHTKDGMGFQLLREDGILCGIITGENTKLVKHRAEKLKLDILEMGIKNKLETVRKICQEYNISLEEVAYVGDDINDTELMNAVGLAFSVPNAMEDVKKYADYVTKREGGNGAVREAIELVLKKNQIC